MIKPELSIIIPTKDRGDIFFRCLDNVLIASADIDCEIIVINDSKLQKLDLKSKEYSKVIVLNNPKSGVASARNLGVSISKSDYILFLDDDIMINKENLDSIINSLNKDPNNCYLPNWTYNHNLLEVIKITNFGNFLIKNNLTNLKGWLQKTVVWDDDNIFEIEIGASYCLPITKSNFNLVNGYNESFPFAGAEDYDFCSRLKKNGVNFFVNPKNNVFHDESDRVSINQWLDRKRRGAMTIRFATEIGYKELIIKKSLYLSFLVIFYGIFKKIVPKFELILVKIGLYDKFLNLLVGLSIYKGYFIDYDKNKII
jgi:GT2 family glycosyltransferase